MQMNCFFVNLLSFFLGVKVFSKRVRKNQFTPIGKKENILMKNNFLNTHAHF